MGGSAAGGGGFPRWGGLRATHYHHMHTSWGMCVWGVWGYGGMYAIIALSRPCGEESLKGRRWRHAKKKGRHAPNPLSLKTRGGGGAGGVAYKDRAGLPPPVLRRGVGGGGGAARGLAPRLTRMCGALRQAISLCPIHALVLPTGVNVG